MSDATNQTQTSSNVPTVAETPKVAPVAPAKPITAPAVQQPPVKKDPFKEALKPVSKEEQLKLNLGTRGVRNLPAPRFPDADLAVRAKGIRKPPYKTDIVLVNPPTPDGAIWIRSQHRVGRRSRENMIWPQMELAQMAALLDKDYSIIIIDAIYFGQTKSMY